ncbi:MAG: hypothetical protein H0V06_08660 [Gemmatimonadetes bacterium]|jgi:hypothetical protein|nr:hypothetical protein [Gemmatimonadota bacterium]MBA3970012.1 hypothetical protein [Gemmatimonadota bacterium]MDQ3309673.1 hypothetical protein [Gemmatimonadota bacterium]MDQ3523344.1 hypothetical protein [Gemmatimonadota bacterium]
MFELIFFVVLSLLVVTGGVLRYRHSLHRRRTLRRSTNLLSDQMIAQIEHQGWVRIDEPDEPLDLKRIREEEKRFWNEAAWDGPEPL